MQNSEALLPIPTNNALKAEGNCCRYVSYRSLLWGLTAAQNYALAVKPAVSSVIIFADDSTTKEYLESIGRALNDFIDFIDCDQGA